MKYLADMIVHIEASSLDDAKGVAANIASHIPAIFDPAILAAVDEVEAAFNEPGIYSAIIRTTIEETCEPDARQQAKWLGNKLQDYYEVVPFADHSGEVLTKAVEVPGDPDGQNDDRAAWAGEAIAAFMKATGTDEEDVLGDLLCNLRHWADRNGHDYELADQRAEGHYEAETGDGSK